MSAASMAGKSAALTVVVSVACWGPKWADGWDVAKVVRMGAKMAVTLVAEKAVSMAAMWVGSLDNLRDDKMAVWMVEPWGLWTDGM